MTYVEIFSEIYFGVFLFSAIKMHYTLSCISKIAFANAFFPF